jgi:O-antigen/teichoic acid export membrane protein
MRATSVVAVGIGVANIGNYLFHLVTARALGPSQYGDVATLVALASLITFPLAGVQFAVARYVAGYAGVGDESAVANLFRAGLRSGLAWGVVIAAVFAALSWPLQRVLHVHSLAAVFLTTLGAAPAVLTPIVLGLVQGLQRFALFSVSIAIAPASRVVLAVVLLALGFGVSGAMAATLAAMVVGLIVPFVPARVWLWKGARGPSPVPRDEAARYLIPVVIGVLSITALTTSDVIAAKAAFPQETAGLYGSASLIGRVLLYLPAAIVMVLLPRVSARAVAGRETIDVLAKSLFATALFGVLGIALYAAVPKALVLVAFGSKFESAAGYLWMFAVAMTAYALVNVLLIYQLGRGVARYSWLLLAGAAVQPLLFAVFHASPRQLLTVDIVIAFALLILHEVLVERTFMPVARELARARWRMTPHPKV